MKGGRRGARWKLACCRRSDQVMQISRSRVQMPWTPPRTQAFRPQHSHLTPLPYNNRHASRSSAGSRRLIALPRQTHHNHASTPKCTCRGGPLAPASRLRCPTRTSLCRAQRWPPRQQHPQQPEMPQDQGRGQDDAASARSTPVVPLLLGRSHGTSCCTCVMCVGGWVGSQRVHLLRKFLARLMLVCYLRLASHCMAATILEKGGGPPPFLRGLSLTLSRLPRHLPNSSRPFFSFISFSHSKQVAVSRFVKDVPSTLTDMADEAANAVGATATGTNPDGSYTNAPEAVEVRALLHICVVFAYVLLLE